MQSNNLVHWSVIGLLLSSFTPGCGGSKEDFERWKKEQEALEAKQAKTKAAAKSDSKKAPAPIELNNIELAELGVRVDVPKGAKTLQDGPHGTSYSLPLQGGLMGIDVHVRAFGEQSLDRAKASATQLGGRVAETKDLGGKLEVVLAPQGKLQTVEVYLPEASVQCKGPHARLAKLREICSSLEPLSS